MNIVKRANAPLSNYRQRGFEDQFGRIVENMFEDMVNTFALGPAWPSDEVAQPRMNMTENDTAFDIEVDMPGVKKDDIKVTVEQQRVTIEGETKGADERREGDKVVYAERSTRRFMRSFMLPSEVDEGSAQARLEDGVLKLTLPKKPGSAATRLSIQ